MEFMGPKTGVYHVSWDDKRMKSSGMREGGKDEAIMLNMMGEGEPEVELSGYCAPLRRGGARDACVLVRG
jgi:hypothetical protein